MQKRAHIFSPSRTILFSMILTIFVGTLALSLPLARVTEIPIIDLFFTATSCTCVTGLLTVPIESFSDFGLIIIMFLMQIGGLGLVTLSLFVVSLFVNLGLATQVVAGEMLDLESWKDTRRIILFIIGMTFFFELLGAIFIFFAIKDLYPVGTSLFYAMFHSISGFCNAGITLFPNSMVPFAGNPLMLLSLSALMFIGGFGFISWKEIFKRIENSFTQRRAQLSLQTRIVLQYYGIFTFANTVLFWILERSNTLAAMNVPMQWINSFFMAISCRSGGYLNIYLHDLQNASILTIMLNAFIGAAPGSTGSGIKLTTTALIIAVVYSVIMNKHSVEMKGRKIMADQIYRSLSIVILSLLWIAGVVFILLVSERNIQFIDILFEAVSAFSTLGASIGITESLSSFGKIIITLTMLVGRIGVISLLLAISTRKEQADYSYPEERIMIT
jgi:trk system potassium uptake protein TrkH